VFQLTSPNGVVNRDQNPAALREPGSILLLSCYELGHPPLGIASPMAFLQRAGYAPEAVDISVQELDPETVRPARFVGISVPMHTALRLGVLAAEWIRALNPRCHICFYGLYATLNSEYLLDHWADTVIGGEWEGPLLALVQSLDAGRSGIVAGVGRKGLPARPALQRLAFPVPNRSRLPRLERYAQLEVEGARRLAAAVEASRGCLHLCRHCPIPPVYGGRLFVVPKEIVLGDIRRLVADGASHITFSDPDFLNGPRHSLAIVRAMHAEFPATTFDFTAKIEHILEHRRMFPELRELGCLFVISAAESLSDTVLAHLDKGHTGADIREALGIVRGADIAFRPTWLPFTPWTTGDDYLEILGFVAREGLIEHVDPVQYALRLLVPPGSLLLRQPAIQPYLGPLDQAAFGYGWAHPDPRMDQLHQAVSPLVEEAAQAGEEDTITFQRVQALACANLDRPWPAPPALPTFSGRGRPPRLTEPWFC
jgi:radical SAM superfamily enzyme YgiQ (UPF0313 family)